MAFLSFRKQSESLCYSIYTSAKVFCVNKLAIVMNNVFKQTRIILIIALFQIIISVTGYATGLLWTSVEVTTESS